MTKLTHSRGCTRELISLYDILLYKNQRGTNSQNGGFRDTSSRSFRGRVAQCLRSTGRREHDQKKRSRGCITHTRCQVYGIMSDVRVTCPRVRPSVASMAIVRTVFSPRCCATSSTSRDAPDATLTCYPHRHRASYNAYKTCWLLDENKATRR